MRPVQQIPTAGVQQKPMMTEATPHGNIVDMVTPMNTIVFQ